MSERDNKFEDAGALKVWLLGRGLDEDDVGAAAETLFKEGNGVKKSSQLLNISSDQLERLGVPILLSVELSNKLKEEVHVDHKTRFRRLAENAAIVVTDSVMKNVLFHFASQITVVTTAEEAADLYKRASRIPGSATEVDLNDENISVGAICPGTDTAKSIILEAWEDGKPRLLKITEKESIDHEMNVWEAICSSAGDKANLVPLRKLDFNKPANVQVRNLAGRDVPLPGEYRSGILMDKYQSTLSRCKIPLTESVLIWYGKQLKTAISTLHECGYCHMDIKPANIFISSDVCHLGDYGGATKIGEAVREHTHSYYPSDAGRVAQKKTDFLLLAVTLLEMYGAVPSPPNPMSASEIESKIAGVDNETVSAFLNELVE